MTRRVFLAAGLLAASTAPVARATGLQSDPDIGRLLERLYGTFSYAPRREPDWATMRSCFIDGAVFILEPAPGLAPAAQDIDAMIADWQTTLRADTQGLGFKEWIDHAAIARNGKVAHVDVTFGARQDGDPRPRRTGMDSLQLMRIGTQWKVTAFIVQYEARL